MVLPGARPGPRTRNGTRVSNSSGPRKTQLRSDGERGWSHERALVGWCLQKWDLPKPSLRWPRWNPLHPPPPKASANSQSQHENGHKHNHARESTRRMRTRTDRKSRRCRWSRSASPSRAWRPPHPRDHPPGRQRQKDQLRIACAEGDRGRRPRSGSLVLKVT